MQSFLPFLDLKGSIKSPEGKKDRAWDTFPPIVTQITQILYMIQFSVIPKKIKSLVIGSIICFTYYSLFLAELSTAE